MAGSGKRAGAAKTATAAASRKAVSPKAKAGVSRAIISKAEDRERTAVRTLQNRIISAASKRGYKDSSRVSQDLPSNVTIGSLRQFIYPQFKGDLQGILRLLRSR